MSLRAVAILVVCCFASAKHRSGTRHTAAVDSHDTHMRERQKIDALVAAGLPSQAGVMDVFNAMETARLLTPQPMDLEQHLTNYELALHDAIFDFLTLEKPGPVDIRSAAPNVGRRSFREKSMTKAQILEEDFMCFPPLRVFAEGLQQFDIYSEGRDVIGPQDLARSYQRSFGFNISSPHAAALIRGLQYNPAIVGSPPIVSRCEFLRGYMKQRGFLDSDLTEGVDKLYPKHPDDWDLRLLLDEMVGHMSPRKLRFLESLFHLDSKDAMSKCEMALVLASCRMHVTTHFMAAEKHETSGGVFKSYRDASIAMFKGQVLFPQTDAHGKGKAKKASLLSDLFVTHDLDGDYALTRGEFSNLLKAMDTWQDLSVANIEMTLAQQRELEEARLASTGSTSGVDIGFFQKYVPSYDVGLIVTTPLSSEITSGENSVKEGLTEVWTNVCDPTTRELTLRRVAKLLTASNPGLEEGAVETSAMKLVTDTVPAHKAEKEKRRSIKKDEYFHSVMSIPNYHSRLHLLDLEYLAGLLTTEATAAPPPPINKTTRGSKTGTKPKGGTSTPTRNAHLGKPIERMVTRQIHTIMWPLLWVFSTLKGSKVGRSLTREEFDGLPAVVPRLKAAARLASKAEMDKLWDEMNAQNDRIMVYDFAMLFADTKMVDGMPVITMSSFVKTPRLLVPIDKNGIVESDILEQQRHEAELQHRGEAIAKGTGDE